MRILHEDESIIIVNKPPGMLSVPGKEKRDFKMSRAEEWAFTIQSLLNSLLLEEETPDSSLISLLSELNQQSVRVPRQDQKFSRYVKRVAKNTMNDSSISSLFQRLAELDRSLFGMIPSELPLELISAADEMENHCNQRLLHIHRLDQETSGLLLFAKDSLSANALSQQFRDRQIEKLYVAKVEGNMRRASVSMTGSIDFPLSADEGQGPRQRVNQEEGKPSLTEYTIISEEHENYSLYHSLFPASSPVEEFTIVELIPHTGRTHQLRVHLSSLGFPIIGDELYSRNAIISAEKEEEEEDGRDENNERRKKRRRRNRLCLHAFKLVFSHPKTREKMTVTALND